jgi:hypothetical protein
MAGALGSLALITGIAAGALPVHATPTALAASPAR